jgi:hypothetical protein
MRAAPGLRILGALMPELFRVVHEATGVPVTRKELEAIALKEPWAYCDMDEDLTFSTRFRVAISTPTEPFLFRGADEGTLTDNAALSSSRSCVPIRHVSRCPRRPNGRCCLTNPLGGRCG